MKIVAFLTGAFLLVGFSYGLYWGWVSLKIDSRLKGVMMGIILAVMAGLVTLLAAAIFISGFYS